MSGAVLDAGALVGFERNDRRVVAIVTRRRQVRLARLLGPPISEVLSHDDHGARAAGQLCGRSRTADVVDASVVVAARQRSLRIVTSDAGDLRRLDPTLDLVTICGSDLPPRLDLLADLDVGSRSKNDDAYPGRDGRLAARG